MSYFSKKLNIFISRLEGYRVQSTDIGGWNLNIHHSLNTGSIKIINHFLVKICLNLFFCCLLDRFLVFFNVETAKPRLHGFFLENNIHLPPFLHLCYDKRPPSPPFIYHLLPLLFNSEFLYFFLEFLSEDQEQRKSREFAILNVLKLALRRFRY